MALFLEPLGEGRMACRRLPSGGTQVAGLLVASGQPIAAEAAHQRGDRADDYSPGRCVCHVRDDGIGIDERARSGRADTLQASVAGLVSLLYLLLVVVAIVGPLAALAGVLVGGLLTYSSEYRKWLRAERHKAVTE